MKNILTLCSLVLLSSCATFNTNLNGVNTLDCNDGYVKYMRYNVTESTIFKKSNDRSVYYVGKNDMLNCDSYPCEVCTKFMCKNYSFKKIKYFNNNENRLYRADMKEIHKDNSENTLRLYKGKKTKSYDANYTWNIYTDEHYEYEQLMNSHNGKLVYEIVLPKIPNTSAATTECAIASFDMYHDIHHGF